MATTLAYGATTITLSDDLLWSDEFDWHPIEQRSAYTLAGALVRESGARLKGRPITLEPIDDDSAWMARSTVAALRTAAAIAGQQFTLTLRGASYTVAFRHEDGAALQARPVMHYADVVAGDWYLATLRLMEV